jgi:hypothetical protein
MAAFANIGTTGEVRRLLHLWWLMRSLNSILQRSTALQVVIINITAMGNILLRSLDYHMVALAQLSAPFEF